MALIQKILPGIFHSVVYIEQNSIVKILPGVGVINESVYGNAIVESLAATDTANAVNTDYVGNVAETLNTVDTTNAPLYSNIVGGLFNSFVYQKYSIHTVYTERVIAPGVIIQENEIFLITVYFGNILESGSTSDNVNSMAIYATSIAESGSLIDTTDVTSIFTASVTETGSATDTVTGEEYFLENLTESGSAVDSVDAIDIQYADISETGSTSDTTDAPNSVYAGEADEVGNAIDSTDVTISTYVGEVDESGNLLDITDQSDETIVTVTENETTIDQTDSVAIFSTSIDETGSASDNTDALVIENTDITETNNIADSVDSTYITFANISETGNSTDQTDTNSSDFTGDIAEISSTTDSVDATYITTADILEIETASDVCDQTSDYNASCTETMNAQDFTDIGPSIWVGEVDEIGNAQDMCDETLNSQNVINENESLLDSTDTFDNVWEGFVFETGNTIDQTDAFYSYNEVNEILDAEDSVDSTAIYSCEVDEIGNTTTMQIVFGDLYANVSETMNAQDVTSIIYIANVSETGNAQDLTDGFANSEVAEILNASDLVNVRYVAHGIIREMLNAMDRPNTPYLVGVSEICNAIDTVNTIPMISETMDAQDQSDAVDSQWLGLVTENGSAVDITNSIPMIYEILSAQDETDSTVVATTGNIIENGNCIDTINAIAIYHAIVNEVGFAYDMADYSNFTVNVAETLSIEDFTDIAGTGVNEILGLIDEANALTSYIVTVTETLSTNDLTDFAFSAIDSLFSYDLVSATVNPANNITPGTGVVPGFTLQPNICGVLSIVKSNDLFSNNLLNTVQSTNELIAQTSQLLYTIPQTVLDEITFNMTDIQNQLSLQLAVISTFNSHISGHYTNFIQRLNFATGQLAVQVGLVNSGGSLPSLGDLGKSGTNPCDAMNLYFGSITGTGDNYLVSISNYMNIVLVAIVNLLNATTGLQAYADQITQNVESATTTAETISTLITNENAQLSSGGGDITNITTTNSIFGFMQNPVAATVVLPNADPALMPFLSDTKNDPVFAGS